MECGVRIVCESVAFGHAYIIYVLIHILCPNLVPGQDIRRIKWSTIMKFRF